jgi:hypothetical protein
MPDFSVKPPVIGSEAEFLVLFPVPVGRHRHQLAEALLALLQRLLGALAREHVVDQALVGEFEVGGALAHQFLDLARALAGGLHEGRQQQRRQQAAGQQQGRGQVVGEPGTARGQRLRPSRGWPATSRYAASVRCMLPDSQRSGRQFARRLRRIVVVTR